MSLVRWIPRTPGTFRDLASVHDEMDRIFDEVMGARQMSGTSVFVPPVDIEETPDAFVVRVDLPGVARKDIKVTLDGDQLTIRGERRSERTEGEGQHIRTERLLGTFERSFTLGSRVQQEGVEAKHADGVLEVRVPKAESSRLREIEVKSV